MPDFPWHKFFPCCPIWYCALLRMGSLKLEQKYKTYPHQTVRAHPSMPSDNSLCSLDFKRNGILRWEVISILWMRLQLQLIKLAGEFLFSIKLLHCFTWITINDSVHSKMISILVNILIPEFLLHQVFLLYLNITLLWTVFKKCYSCVSSTVFFHAYHKF